MLTRQPRKQLGWHMLDLQSKQHEDSAKGMLSWSYSEDPLRLLPVHQISGQFLPLCGPQFPYLNGEEIGLNALPGFSLLIPWPSDHWTCYSSTLGTGLHCPKCGAQTASIRRSQCVCLKCRFPGHKQTHWLRIGGRGKAGGNLFISVFRGFGIFINYHC